MSDKPRKQRRRYLGSSKRDRHSDLQSGCSEYLVDWDGVTEGQQDAPGVVGGVGIPGTPLPLVVGEAMDEVKDMGEAIASVFPDETPAVSEASPATTPRSGCPFRLPFHFRFMVRRDLPALLAIEQASFPYPWDEQDFMDELRPRNVWCIVAEVDGEVAGFMVYELEKHAVMLSNFAVHPAYRRCGVGRAMIDKLKGKLSLQRRRWLRAVVIEWNAPAHLFFRACGLRAVSVLRGHFAGGELDEALGVEGGADGYLFQCRAER